MPVAQSIYANQAGLRTRAWEGAKVRRSEPKSVYSFFSEEKARTEKDKVRFLSISFIQRHFNSLGIRKMRALTLPGIYWPFEKQLSYRLGNNSPAITSHYVCCERDYNVFKNAVSRMPCHPRKGVLKVKYCTEVDCEMVNNGRHILLFYADIFDFVEKQPELNYNLIWFDSTSLITTFSHKLHLLVEKLRPGGIFMFTSLKARERIEIEDRAKYISDIVAPYGLTLQRKLEYFDSIPMIHLIFTKAVN